MLPLAAPRKKRKRTKTIKMAADAKMEERKETLREIAEPWTNDTFNSVDWQANQSSFSALAPGQKIQISKYAHEWTLTMHKCTQAKGNKIDHRCFACGNLKETVNHMLQCKSDRRVAARAKALQEFRKHLS
jgi:hypothetical protein